MADVNGDLPSSREVRRARRGLGWVPVMSLAERAGLKTLGRRRVRVGAHTGQLLSRDRTCQAVSELFGVPV